MTTRWPTALLIAAIASLLVFVLPFYVPVRPVYGISASYLAGFNNSVAVLGASAVSACVFLLTLRQTYARRTTTRDQRTEDGRVGWSFAAPVITASALVLGGWSFLVVRSGQRYLGDAGYIIEQASTWSVTGRHLYSQIEFAYGPLLILPAVWLARALHLSIIAGYFISFVLESALGLLLLTYVLDRLPIKKKLRRWAFVLFALGAITPHLGTNYTYFRFASPFAILLFATKPGRNRWLTTVHLCAGIALQMAISPELAFPLAFGIAAYVGTRSLKEGASWLLVGALPLACMFLLLMTTARAYLRMVATFSHGVYNLPIGPYPHVLVYLFSLVWLMPVGIGRLASRMDLQVGRYVALYAISLGMVPAALSRCDPLHIVFNGLGTLALSLPLVSEGSRRLRQAWLFCLVGVVLWEQRVNQSFFAYRTAETVQGTLLPHLAEPARRATIWLVTLPNRSLRRIMDKPVIFEPVLQTNALDKLTGRDKIATPLEITPAAETALKLSGHYSPLYRAFGVDMGDAAAEQECVQELTAFRWMLLPTVRNLASYQLLPQNAGSLQGMRMYFHQRRPSVFTPGAALEGEVSRAWTPVQQLGEYTLYRHR